MFFEMDTLIMQMFIAEWNIAKEEPAQPDVTQWRHPPFQKSYLKNFRNQKEQNFSCLKEHFLVFYPTYPLWVVKVASYQSKRKEDMVKHTLTLQFLPQKMHIIAKACYGATLNFQ